jgi:predicted  nucleic acid-binding Zn-ribbon protein
MGCILHELATGRKAFHTDVAVLEHRLSGLSGAAFTVTIDPSFTDFSGGAIHDRIHEMLQIEPSSRPAASSLYETFSEHYIYVKSQDPLAIAKAAQEDMNKRMSTLEEAYRRVEGEFTVMRDSYRDLRAEMDISVEEKEKLQALIKHLTRDSEQGIADMRRLISLYKSLEEDTRTERAMLESKHERLRTDFGAEMVSFHANNENLRKSMTKLTEERGILQSGGEKLQIKVSKMQPRSHPCGVNEWD